MKKYFLIGGMIGTTLLFTGCAQTLGKMLVKTGMTPDMKIVNNKKIVKKRLNEIAGDSVEYTKLKPISPDDVFVFNESSTPPYCKDVGWIIVKDSDGFNKIVEKKIGLFNNRQLKNRDIDAIRAKAAGLGIEAVNDHPSLGKFEFLNQYVKPYVVRSYIISPTQIKGYVDYYDKCSKTSEDKCKKILSDKKLSKDIRMDKFEQCLVQCSVNEYGRPKRRVEVVYGVKGMLCNKDALKKLRGGETTAGVLIDYKAQKLISSLTQKEKKVDLKNEKNKKKQADIFKF